MREKIQRHSDLIQISDTELAERRTALGDRINNLIEDVKPLFALRDDAQATYRSVDSSIRQTNVQIGAARRELLHLSHEQQERQHQEAVRQGIKLRFSILDRVNKLVSHPDTMTSNLAIAASMALRSRRPDTMIDLLETPRFADYRAKTDRERVRVGDKPDQVKLYFLNDGVVAVGYNPLREADEAKQIFDTVPVSDPLRLNKHFIGFASLPEEIQNDKLIPFVLVQDMSLEIGYSGSRARHQWQIRELQPDVQGLPTIEQRITNILTSGDLMHNSRSRTSRNNLDEFYGK